jgi:hexosaminidase
VIPSIPELSGKGAYGPGLWYTPEDFEEIQHFASMRGIQAYIEIDMPGHTNSISYSHPELIAGSNMQPNWAAYASEPPSGQLKLNNSQVREFMSLVLADLLPRTRTTSNYFHTGGDEVNLDVYSLDPGISSNSMAIIRPYLERFILYDINLLL